MLTFLYCNARERFGRAGCLLLLHRLWLRVYSRKFQSFHHDCWTCSAWRLFLVAVSQQLCARSSALLAPLAVRSGPPHSTTLITTPHGCCIEFHLLVLAVINKHKLCKAERVSVLHSIRRHISKQMNVHSILCCPVHLSSTRLRCQGSSEHSTDIQYSLVSADLVLLCCVPKSLLTCNCSCSVDAISIMLIPIRR